VAVLGHDVPTALCPPLPRERWMSQFGAARRGLRLLQVSKFFRIATDPPQSRSAASAPGLPGPSSAYVGLPSVESALPWGPRSPMLPWSSTRIWSASRTVGQHDGQWRSWFGPLASSCERHLESRARSRCTIALVASSRRATAGCAARGARNTRCAASHPRRRSGSRRARPTIVS